ncbi:serine kinase [Laspinema olomoucense]|uniref:Serine kinase n=1 Tax=Laspinema olomoucense D3b TaxID=2953688 RepID=A0ABT2NBM4_9CYAN|nr:serine kinase [Laspinema sp. D3b]MCT7980092.1 serine kinase [Laspinema sp. D3b]
MVIPKKIELEAATSNTDPQAPIDFFNAVGEKYKTAEVASEGSVERFYNLAGHKIRLCFAGSALIPYLTPALSHLEIEAVANPELTVCLWDSESTHTAMLPPPWSKDCYHPKRGEIIGYNTDRIHTSFQWGSYALSLLDRDRNLGIYWISTVKQIPYWETGAPLRTIFNVWLNQREVQLVHAGAVGLPEGGVLLAGKGGSGKSTSALACLNSNLFYASDDYCLISPTPTPTVFSLYNTGKKNADDVERLPFLASAIRNRDRLDTEKALYFIHQTFPEKILNHFPIKAILIPRIAGTKDTTLEPTSSTSALTALAPSTMIQLPGTGKEACQMMKTVADRVPCYELRVGTEIEQIPQTIFQLLSQGIH